MSTKLILGKGKACQHRQPDADDSAPNRQHNRVPKPEQERIFAKQDAVIVPVQSLGQDAHRQRVKLGVRLERRCYHENIGHDGDHDTQP